MLEERTAVFLMTLIQDFNILRPLALMAHRDFGCSVVILVSSKFRVRDAYGIWDAELELLRQETAGRLVVFGNDLEAFRNLQGSGIIFSASESAVREHSAAHNLFRYAPPTFLKVTLQHGFECVGFRHNASHDQAHGPTSSFAADLVCSWQPPELQPALAPSQLCKVRVTGSPAVLQTLPAATGPKSDAPGLVCENLHSVRLNATAHLKDEFVSSFSHFCSLMEEDGQKVALRPHPAGQYVLKHRVELPPNVLVNNAPMHRLNLRQFAYGISAPSSVLIDLLLADVPVAVWQDSEGAVDTGNYASLTHVSSPVEWREFAREAQARPEPFVEAQRRFLADQQMPIDPVDVFTRFAAIFRSSERMTVPSGGGQPERQRLLIVANAHLPTVQVCLEHPLRSLVRSGELRIELLTEHRLKQQSLRLGSNAAVEDWLGRALDHFNADAIMFSRYSGPHHQRIRDWATQSGVPAIYHVDDDLLGVPESLGPAKHAYHNAPERLATVRSLLTQCDLVYASTEVLRRRLTSLFPGISAVAGSVNCSGTVLRGPEKRPARVVGYMASADHLSNLRMVLPAVVGLLERHSELGFELFGSIPVPPELERFGTRIRSFDPVDDYETFLAALREREWDVGICPLVSTEFNLAKSNNKWVEYTSLGIATVASSGTVYDQCCADGCGELAAGLDEWDAALERLVTDAAERVAMVERAQLKLRSEYGIARHRQQILGIIESARAAVAENAAKENA